MRSPLLLSLTLTFLTTLSHAISTPTNSRQISIFAWPLLTTKPQTLAQITYTPTNATLDSYTPISIPSNSEIVRIGFHHSPGGEWSGIATSAMNLAKGVSKTLILHVRPDGELYHVGWKVGVEPVSQGKGRSTIEEGKLTVEVLRIKEGPVPSLNKPVVISEDGEEAKEPEKSFLQKYWWALALFLVFQVVMGGSKE